MTPESNNFEQLRRLMALKRHEVPPPGYFDNFSREVMSRIRAGKTAAPAANLSWTQRLWQMLEVRPAYAGAFGFALCALLTGGVIYSAKLDAQSGNPSFANNSFPTLPTSPAAAFTSTSMGLTPGTDSLNGTPQSSDLFNQQIEVQPASFHPAGN